MRVTEKGEVVVELPVSGQQLKLRPPKGKDLKTLEKAAKNPDVTNIDLMATLVSVLSTPEVSIETLMDLDAEDLMAAGEALSHFRALSSVRPG